jgi:nucleotide-binding universal stress UspA family protein
MEDQQIVPSPIPLAGPIATPGKPLYKIFHPTDLSPVSDIAFAHALKLALLVHGELRIMHVDPDIPQTDWSSLPRVRETLNRWGALPEGSSREDVVRLGVHIEKILAYHEEPTRSLEQHLRHHPADLLVLAKHQPDILARLFSKPVAEPLARHTRIPALFIPEQSDGFVSVSDGHAQLERIVIPIDQQPIPHVAVEAAVRFATMFRMASVTFTLLHIGSQDELPALHLVEHPGWIWQTSVSSGDVIEAIISASETADLIVMATEGPHGFFDALLGSTTERVLREVQCPLLTVPVKESGDHLDSLLA